MPEDKPMTKDNPISEVKEYFQFHTLPTRKENLLQRVEYGFENAGKLYDDHTLLLTQVLDRGDQQELLDQLKKDMSFAQTRGEKDTAKQRYWDSLASRSAFTALNEIGDKMEGNFSIGLKGGRKVDITQDYGDLNEIFSSLNNLSPNLLNTQLIWEAFKPVGPGDRRLWDLKEIFDKEINMVDSHKILDIREKMQYGTKTTLAESEFQVLKKRTKEIFDKIRQELERYE